MKKIITAINNPNINEELKNEKDVEIICKDIQYKEGILEILENKELEINYIIIDENLPGEIELEKLIEKILEINEKIKIIITIKKQNKNKINFKNNKIIKIFYENKINLNTIKKYKNNIKEINIVNKKIENNKTIMNKKNINKTNFNKNKIKIKNNNLKKIENKEKIKTTIRSNLKKTESSSKIITILGDYKVGKSITIINLIDYIIQKKNKNVKILIVELNSENPSFYTIFGSKKFNYKTRYKYKNNKIRIKVKKIKEHKKFRKKYLSNNIIENLIININKNIDLISYNKLINFNIIKILEKKLNNYL